VKLKKYINCVQRIFCFDDYFAGKIWLCCFFQIHHQIENAHLKNFKYDHENLGPALFHLCPVERGRCGQSLFFVLEGKETNKSFKNTMSLNGIDH
jgi:hypothetical protein